MKEKKKLGIYIHFPFCLRKCDYCDFYSTSKTDSRLVEQYVDALAAHMGAVSEEAREYVVDSVFLGGGTPTILPAGLICKVLDALRRGYIVSPDCEITIEANPATVSQESLSLYRAAGINRISIGLQSAHCAELSALSRLHSADDFTSAMNQARAAGFENINIDIMYGIPGQTLESFAKTLDFALSRKPEHISAYALKIEEGTPLSLCERSSLCLPDEDAEWDMYLFCIDLLSKHGYRQYEISNFARSGRECRHNLKYWSCGEYIGFGASAHSYFGGIRYAYLSDFNVYTECVLTRDFEKIITQHNIITPQESESEYIMLSLRLSEGICTEEFRRRYNKDFEQIYRPRLERFIETGYAVCDGRRYFLTPRGMFVSNYILSSIIDF